MTEPKFEPNNPTALPAQVAQQRRQRQLEMAFENARLGVFPLFISFCCYTAILANYVAPTRLALWLVTSSALVALRGILNFAQLHDRRSSTRQWSIAHMVLLALIGSAYGVTALWLQMPGELWLLALVNLWLGGIAIAAFVGHGIMPVFGAAFAAPVILPLLGRLLLAGSPALAALGVCNILLYIYIAGIVLRMRRMTLNEVKCRIEAELQTEQAILQQQRADLLIQQLKREVSRRKRIQGALTEARNAARHQSEHDHLTGLANRRIFDRELSRAWQHAYQERQPVSIVLCDIDRFAAYNTRYGHHAGDLCLARIANVVGELGLREGDLAARFGGEEFALLLAETGEYAALEIAENLRAKIFDQTILHGASEVERVVTASVGVATMIPDAEHSEQALLQSAAQALKRAKIAGRNCVYTVFGRGVTDENQ